MSSDPNDAVMDGNPLLDLFSSEVQLGTPFYRDPVTDIVAEVTAYSDRESERFATPQLINLMRIQYAALGLVGEAGEVASEVKKILRNDGGVLTDARRDKIIEEYGDMLWYIVAGLSEVNATLEDAMVNNIEKLRKRRAEGTIKERAPEREVCAVCGEPVKWFAAGVVEILYHVGGEGSGHHATSSESTQVDGGVETRPKR